MTFFGNLAKFFIFLPICLPAGSEERNIANLAAAYFSSKQVRMVTSGLCERRETNVWLSKWLSGKGIAFDFLDLKTLNETEVGRRLTSTYLRLGVLVDLKCSHSMELLAMASGNHLFSSRRSLIFWLIVARSRITRENLDFFTANYQSETTDPLKFLMGPYDDKKNEKYLLEINKQVNSYFIEHHEETRHDSKPKIGLRTNKTEIDELIKMKIFPDNEIALAIPGPEGNSTSYDLYSICKDTLTSPPKFEEIGKVRLEEGVENGLELKKESKWRKLDNAVLKAASAIFQPEAFTTIDDLATREIDIWSKMTYSHVRLLAEDLNFRVIIRFFDDYGWQENGTFGYLMGLLQQKKADLSAAGLLMRTDRLGVAEFLECPFQLQIGILFREPSLSSVSNIFLLPFSKAIWISIGAVIVLTVMVLQCRAMSGRKLVPPDNTISNFLDIGNYIIGAICQQGFACAPKSMPARISILVLLLNSLALFTSYSACIVALLQSSSSAILSVSDITKSNLEVGIQANFPLYKVLIKEAVHPVLKEFYDRKVLIQGDKVFWERRRGIEKMRTGMFAFEVELTAGYKVISETYEEREKCGIKEIDLIPKPLICIAVRKSSPYKEMFTRRLRWQNEAGLFDRSWKLWVDQKPKCEMGRIGFISVGLTEFRPALQAFAYGTLAALIIFCLELLLKRKNQNKRFIRKTRRY